MLKSGLISMHIDLKIEALTGGLLDNIPILTSRAFVSDIMLQDGSSAVMLSDLSKDRVLCGDRHPRAFGAAGL